MVQNFTKFVQNRFEKMIFLFYKSSVTRFGEIPPLWQNFKTLGQFFECLVSVGQNFETTLAHILFSLANFHCCKWPNINQKM